MKSKEYELIIGNDYRQRFESSEDALTALRQYEEQNGNWREWTIEIWYK